MFNFEIADIFKHRNRTCVVVRVNIGSVDVFHNGYVSVRDGNKETWYDYFQDRIETCELTFSDYLDQYDEFDKEKWFLGFDTAHSWNDRNSESKAFSAVRERTKNWLMRWLIKVYDGGQERWRIKGR
ncbi:MAG: hypothetical protein ACLFUR_06650 [Candidatus Hadarchaeia archaeon]